MKKIMAMSRPGETREDFMKRIQEEHPGVKIAGAPTAECQSMEEAMKMLGDMEKENSPDKKKGLLQRLTAAMMG